MDPAPEDCSWVLDSIVGFLQGPVWTAPVLTFIEHKSSIFEPGATEHEQEYKKVFEEYKDLVDSMLTSYMEDIGITPEQFQEACDESKTGILQVRFQQALFEQVWAANDYEVFRRMMAQKNLELQLQALELIQQRCGVVPQSLLPPDGEPLQSEQELQLMEHVIRRSIEDYEASRAQLDSSTLQLEQSLAAATGEHQRLEAECRRERALLHSALQHSLDSSAPSPVPEEKSQIEPEKTAPLNEVPQPEEMARRQQYLRQQRDKLLALKRRERERQLQACEKSARPRSARAAQAAQGAQGSPGSQGPQGPQGAQPAPAGQLQARRALAERLRAEVASQHART
ncbi:cilia- and flagella-associated protein 36 [Bacillus rossius redtenbacheri]|uniref:cilia- and flagella-associated protein 36 n=1 Tax=Bacillus rossius redtenbacheri TaxID=93214 RepID=UPI002FDCE3D2